MGQITYENFQNINRKIKEQQALNRFESLIAVFLRNGKKYSSALEKLLNAGPVDEDELPNYLEKISLLFSKIGFAPPFLIKELPKEYIDSFDSKKWGTVTRFANFKNLNSHEQRGFLRLCWNFGVFERDSDADSRIEKFRNLVQPPMPIRLEECEKFHMNYYPQFLEFFLQNKEKLSTDQLIQIQNNWGNIEKYLEIKSIDNILNYLEITSQTNDPFEIYMRANGISEAKQQKYRIIYEHMAGRTQTSIPTVSGKKEESGYTYEVLQYTDPRILRFGENHMIKCCQKLGGNGEGSMIYSAIESSARVVMVHDEKGELIAGSLVTHQIGKDGKSHVCFDSIEVNANRARIRTKQYQATLRKIEKLKREGKLQYGTLEEIEEFYKKQSSSKKNETQVKGKGKIITKDDIRALRTNKKIQDVYFRIADDMYEKDEAKRKEQLLNGEISSKEYSHLLMKNGLFTIGRNPVSMYLGNLELADKKSMEGLPLPQKSRSIYRRAHWRLNWKKLLNRISLIGLDTLSTLGVGLSALAFGTGVAIPPVVLGLTAASIGGAIWGHKIIKKNKVKGVYSDAMHEQRIVRDGRKDEAQEEDITNNIIQNRNRIRYQQKLLYHEEKAIKDPTRLKTLDFEEQRSFRRLAELSRKSQNQDFDNKFIIGNLKNWGAVFSRIDGQLVLEEVLLPNPLSMSRDPRKLTDAQNNLIANIQEIMQSEEVEFKCLDQRINRYLTKCMKGKTKNPSVIDKDLAYEVPMK